MNYYKIKIYNEEEDAWKERLVEKLSFPEAVMVANNLRTKLGYSWKIISISKDEKGSENV